MGAFVDSPSSLSNVSRLFKNFQFPLLAESSTVTARKIYFSVDIKERAFPRKEERIQTKLNKLDLIPPFPLFRDKRSILPCLP